ncbi:extracellular solute-binding protein [Geobacillus sp. G4]|uniref:Xylotriose lipo-binding protein n=5 Tax=Geobacillus TaxID=129337 RepID=Q09LZ5_GEOSE|nr:MULTISPECIES: extracellular solute-binding protein [Geobacillus]ABI49932.1 xylotriose lipo-binding protein [Geobacillus stearothermophilus]ADI26638.1 extracellular solute-binding protein family 1 [Geobacillus sp. C56-T3]AMQ20678.1 ABC transporter substrate-binding protein [Geobacillus sp. JS12]AOL34695.1 ABC transporter substrate-binding protein [Geobacillus thermoleovorans]AWO75891.1 ABC transporter substrate-binding protein [Geobacillus thermoleovorans]
MKKKAFTWLVLLMLMAGIVLSGCSSSSSDSASEGKSGDGKIHLKFMHDWPKGSSTAYYNLVEEIIKDYEAKHPNVQIDVEVLNPDQYRDKLKVLAASNELPDVGLTWSNGFAEPYATGGQFAPLNDIIEKEFKDQFVPGTVEAYTFNGKSYALPMEMNITYIFYNKEIFKKYGLQEPKTFEDLKNIGKTLIKHGVIPATVGSKDGWPASMWFMYLADRIGGPTILTDVIQGKVKMSDPAIVKAAKEVQNLVDMGFFVKGNTAFSNDDAKGYFLNEKAAMFLTATWELPNFTTSPDVPQEFKEKVGYFKFPLYEGGKGTDINSYVGGPGLGAFVAENSKHKEQAKDFAAYLVKEWGKRSVEGAGILPATKVNTEGLNVPKMYLDVLHDINNATNITTWFDTQASPNVSELHHDLMTALFGKQITPEEFAKQHDDALAEEANK